LIGLRTEAGEFTDKNGATASLADLNDNGKKFAAIAKIIESKPEGLFVD